ncbi:hypothetical protein J6590_044528 [Homalodisca vitripennis]|nr:hypothetical protein J6590_044528 [Homalodisca vitripennis]
MLTLQQVESVRITWKAKTVKENQEWECEKCRASTNRTTGLGLGKEGSENPAFFALREFVEKMSEKQEKIITGRVDRIMAVIAEFEQNSKTFLIIWES